MANAEAVLKLRQADYDSVKWDAGIAARPEALALEQATNTYLRAKALYDEVTKGPGKAALDAARARVQVAAGQLATLKAVTSPADIAVAQAEIRRAQAQLDLIEARARQEAIVAAEASLAAQKAEWEIARIASAETELRAPFTGTIVTLTTAAGEQVAAGAVIAQVADLSKWLVETTDLTELQVVNVHTDASVTITFDALPGLTLGGRILRIRAPGENKQGDITYTALIEPRSQDERLHWNMTALVTIGR